MDRMEELQKIASSLKVGNFYKRAAGEMGMPMGGAPPMDPSMMGGGMPPMMPPESMPPMDPSMMGGMPPMDPSMMGGAPVPGIEAEKGMKEVALRALDLTNGVISVALESENLSPSDQLNSAAAALETSGALNGVPPEEIAALAQQQPAM